MRGGAGLGGVHRPLVVCSRLPPVPPGGPFLLCCGVGVTSLVSCLSLVAVLLSLGVCSGREMCHDLRRVSQRGRALSPPYGGWACVHYHGPARAGGGLRAGAGLSSLSLRTKDKRKRARLLPFFVFVFLFCGPRPFPFSLQSFSSDVALSRCPPDVSGVDL
mgnify:CR=1 FL=1